MDKLKVPEPTQDRVLMILLQGSYFLALTKSQIEPWYFTSVIYQEIYKAIRKYYHSFSEVPSKIALLDIIKRNFEEDSLVDFEDIKEKVNYYYSNLKEESEEASFDVLSDFIQHARLYYTLKQKLLPSLEDSKPFDLEGVSKQLLEVAKVNFTKSRVFNLSDSKSLKEHREATCADEVITSIFNGINHDLQYGGYIKGNLHLVVAATGVGKTSYLINEASHAALNHKKRVLNIFIGDMVQYDGWLRYVACISGKTQDEIINMSDDDQKDFVKNINDKYDNILDRIDIMVYAPSEVSVTELIQEIYNIQDNKGVHYDFIVIDYADNLEMDSGDTMYEARGIVYDQLALLARVNQSAVFVASQPKLNEWDNEILTIKCASESSKKQHIVDVMVGLGLVARGSDVGTLHIIKVRRGLTGRLIRFRTEWQSCRIHTISEDEHAAAKELATRYNPEGGKS